MRKWILLTIIGIVFVMSPCAAFAKRVVIDPGHGGSDPGAIGVNSLQEKTVNLATGLIVQDELQKRGYDVVMTRTTDRFLSLQDRVDIADQANADAFVSIHANHYTNPSVRGSLVLYYDKKYPQPSYPATKEMTAFTPENKMLASLVQSHIVRETNSTDRGLVPSAVFVVRRGTIPSILVETAFLSNKEDAALLANDSFRRQMGVAIANGIDEYLSPIFRDVYGHWAKDPIARVKELGLIEGYDNGKFKPDAPLSRAEFVAMLDRLFHFTETPMGEDDHSVDVHTVPSLSAPGDEASEPLNTESPASQEEQEDVTNEMEDTQSGTAEESTDSEAAREITSFTDVTPNHWAYPTLAEAVKQGYLQGYPDNELKPDRAVSREEVAALFDRFLSEKGGVEFAQASMPSEVPMFLDVTAQSWSTPAIYRLWTADLIRGVNDVKFDPKRKMTRAEMTVIIDRFVQKESDVMLVYQGYNNSI